MCLQQCMTRAVTLIKIYFVGSLRALTQDVSRRLFELVRYGDVYLFIACLNLHHRMSPTRPKCISYIHASQRYLGRFPRSSDNSDVAPVRTPTSWDHCYPNAMPRTLAHTRIYLFRLLQSKFADSILQATRTELVELVCIPLARSPQGWIVTNLI